MKTRDILAGVLEGLAGTALLCAVAAGVIWALPRLVADVHGIAACPIHVTTSHDDYCVSIGIGQ